jgi:pyroglutamyl-peptidase
MTRADAPRILLTGFEPFDGESINPSWEVVQALHGQCIAGHRVQAIRLPVSFRGALSTIDAGLQQHRPAIVLAVGQAGGRARLSFERIAVNLIDARIPDNDGQQPIDRPVIPAAPAAYFATVPVKARRIAAEAAGVPAELSHSAGCYVCNAVFFALMHALARCPQARGGFVHLPWLPAQAARHPGQPSLSLAQMIRGLEHALQATATRDADLPIAGGDTH